MKLAIKPHIVEKFRQGDIRHCYSDISKARRILDYEPQVAFEDGVPDLVKWVKKQESLDLVNRAVQELEQRGLTK